MILSKRWYLLIGTLIVLLAGLPGYYYFKPAAIKLVLIKKSFAQLPEWSKDDHGQALLALQRSCHEILKRSPTANFSFLPQSGSVADWQKICLAAAKIKNTDHHAARVFFETWFQPYQVSDGKRIEGLFTGYYLPLLHGSMKADKKYMTPIYGMPNDLIKINLGLFRANLAGTTIIAQQTKNKLHPYPDRAAIINGAINKRAPVLLWGDNAIDLFFAQIQGSALVELPNGKRVIIHYAGSNGRPYTAIGKVLIAQNALPSQNISMQTIRTWLQEHPQEINTVLNQNASYVFFSLMAGPDPLGMEQVPLLSQRSLAVDTSILPLGAPIWLDTTAPVANAKNLIPFQHLLIAQDTGGAIRGIVRGDVYWGAGDDAAFSAGHMQSSGKFWILLPRSCA
jgi:membrane-bound lytic murein transglycosylase A